MLNILEKDLTPEEEKVLRESLDSWREEVTASLMEQVEADKEKKLAELEEANIAYREQLKEEFSDKLIKALNEMREEITSEVTAEIINSNPELQILEKIKELVAPTLNEEYVEKTYAEELLTLRNKVKELESEKILDEGARTLAELISDYPESKQNLFIHLVSPGSPEEVTESFYNIAASLDEAEKEGKEASKEDKAVEKLQALMGDVDEETAKKLQKVIDDLGGDEPEEPAGEIPVDDGKGEDDINADGGESEGDGGKTDTKKKKKDSEEEPEVAMESFDTELETYIKENSEKENVSVGTKPRKLNPVLEEIKSLGKRS